jgi:hypothetical protein
MANEVGFAGLRTPDMDPDCESKKAIDWLKSQTN